MKHSGFRRAALAFLGTCCLVTSALQAGDGISFTGSKWHPGKLDLHYLYNDFSQSYNFIWWSPTFKGGFGLIAPDRGDDVEVAGGYLRPLAGRPEAGELIIGVGSAGTPGRRDVEAMVEYRLPSGFGIGGGVVERDNSDLDLRFAKLSYRHDWTSWNTILSLQVQEIGDESSPGGYLALYNERLMLTYGNDGEQWRTALGYVSPGLSRPGGGKRLRPAFEVLYVDNTLGDLGGPKLLFVNATLGFKGGFLSHPARLGRAMGPTGLEFGNPLGFLRPTWNRRLDVWELGGVADFRLVRLQLPSGMTTTTWEAVAFPFQLDGRKNRLDSFFVGGSLTEVTGAGGADSEAVLAGFLAKIGFLQVAIGAEHDLDTDETTVRLGLIDKF